MRFFVLCCFAVVALAGCSGVSPRQKAADRAAVMSLAAQELASAYDSIGAFCLNIAEGNRLNAETLTSKGFKKFQDTFERTWTQGSVTSGFIVDAKISPLEQKGCAISVGYEDDHVLPFPTTQPIRDGLVAYLIHEGFELSDQGDQTVTVAAADSEPLFEFKFGRNNIQSAKRGDTEITLASYERDGVMYEFFEREIRDGLVF